MLGPDIFISYAREDEGVARLFASAFSGEGFNVWWDAAIHSGETFDEVIEKELRSARAVVVLWSPRSVSSRWVRAEATLADRNRTLAPVVIEPCNRPIIFELTHTVDLSHWSGDVQDAAWQVFVQDVRHLVEAGRAAAEKDGNEPAPVLSTASRPHAPPPPPARPSAAPSGGEALDNSKVENLISMLSSLQEQMKQGGTQQPAASPAPAEPEGDDEATQFFTASDHSKFMEGDEFHCLEVMSGEEVVQRYLVGPLGLKIGRSAPADVVLADSKVSRSHCLVELKEDELFVSDLNSTNGTFVEGKRVTGAALLPVGSTLALGDFALVHRIRHRNEVQ